MRRASWALLAAVVAFGPSAAADALDDRLAKSRGEVVGRLERVATWADGQRIAAFRDGVFRRILTFDADHARARAGLKFRRASKKGPWVQDPYRSPANWNLASLPEAERRMSEAMDPYREEVLALTAEADGVRRERLHDHLLDLFPQDATVRRAVGHVQHEGTWMLPESVGSRAARERLRAAGRRHRKEVATEVGPYLEGVSAGWPASLQVGRWRVLGTAVEDAPTALELAAAGEAFCADLFPEVPRPERKQSILILESREQAREHLRKHDPERLADAELVGGLSMTDGTYLVFQSDRRARRTSAMRKAIARFLPREHEGRSRGWMSEGMGQRLCWYVAGEHGPTFLRIEGTDRANTSGEEAFLPQDTGAWIATAARVLERDGARRLGATLGKTLNAMGASDVLVAYALSAYLLEARPETVVPFLEASSSKDDVNEIVSSTLGCDVPALAARLRRWCLEAP